MKFSKMMLGAAVSLLASVAGAQNNISAAAANQSEITILHINDMHGRVVEGISVARISTMVENFRAENPNTLLFDAGDTVHGLPIANLFEGGSMIELMNEIGFDGMVAGNHDFNFGLERLQALNNIAEFPIMGANVINEAGDVVLDDYQIFVKDGVRIGVFGLATPDTLYRTHPRNVEGLDFVSPTNVAAQMVSHLEPQTDIIIALGHLGITPSSFYTSLRVIENVPGIDIFIDGHSHTLFEEGRMVNGTLLVSTGAHTQHFGVVDLVVENGKLISANAHTISAAEAAHIPQDQTILDKVTDFQADIQIMGAEILGYTTEYLDGYRGNVRTRETNLGNLTADIMLSVTDADIALVNGGSIRDSILPGQVSLRDLHTVFPFGGVVEVREITGAAILAALEHGTRSYPFENGAFPQVAGVNFEINIARPAGYRVENVYIGGQPLDLAHTYRLATRDFIGNGGDGYAMIAAAPLVLEVMGVTEAITEFFRNHEGSISPIVEGRIVITDDALPTWNANQIFNENDRVIYNETIFQAQWWTRNERPGTNPWGAWMEIGQVMETAAGDFYAWTNSRVFDRGDKVYYGGQIFRANWWSRNQNPISSGAWELVQ